ncbi:MAG: DHH family phosphoesterase, partial [Oscillospiraceae bacterium]|nr:DHH family phosphoesterase [Oscillospiraceae bacterium]
MKKTTPLQLLFITSFATTVIFSLFIFNNKFSALLVACNILLQLILLLIFIFGYKWYTKRVIIESINSFKEAEKITIEQFPMPVIVTSHSGNILYCNSQFTKKISSDKKCQGESIYTLISNKNLNEILKYKCVDIVYNGHHCTVFVRKLNKCLVFYFLENTHYKMASIEYSKSQPVVALVTFDNKEEIVRNSVDGQDLQITAQVEKKLQDWANETAGFLKKVGSNKYLILMEERHLRKFVSEKFKILENIREIKDGSEVQATISAGIGRGGATLKETENWAKKAFEMALGRGGDQVVIKKDSSYSFFGGTSKDSQNRNKVRARMISNTLSNHIKASDKVLIMGHKFSDLDSIGASIGVHVIVAKTHSKNAFIVVNEKQSLATKLINDFKGNSNDKKIFIAPQEALNMVTEKTLLVVVDVHNPSLFESEKLYNSIDQVVVIDHHRMMRECVKNAVIFYHEPHASSSSEMVAELIQYLADNTMEKREAQALLAGMMLDTRNFVVKTGTRTFEAAAFLRRKNADTTEAKRLFVHSIDMHRQKSKLSASAEIFENCILACTTDIFPEIRTISAQVANELLEIENVQASFVLYPFENGVGICARSLGVLNVQI